MLDVRDIRKTFFAGTPNEVRSLQGLPTWGDFTSDEWGGGALFDLGVHPLALAMLLGNATGQGRVTTVAATLLGGSDHDSDEQRHHAHPHPEPGEPGGEGDGERHHREQQQVVPEALEGLDDAGDPGPAQAHGVGRWYVRNKTKRTDARISAQDVNAAAHRLRLEQRTDYISFLREMGRLYHAAGVERLVRNSLWKGRSAERFYDAMEWLYGWNANNCLAQD